MPGDNQMDVYHPLFGTEAKAKLVATAFDQLLLKLNAILGPVNNSIAILDVVQQPATGEPMSLLVTERELRVLRFALRLAQQDI